MKHWRTRWQWVAGSVVLAVMGVSAFRLVRASPATMPRAEDVAKGTRTAAPLGGASDERATKAPPGTVSGSGVVEPRDRQTNVSAPVAGRIAAVAAREGQRVNAGDVLVELEGSVERRDCGFRCRPRSAAPSSTRQPCGGDAGRRRRSGRSQRSGRAVQGGRRPTQRFACSRIGGHR
jgi:hypothetical protein